MAWICSACHGTNPAGMRFCGHCGAQGAEAQPSVQALPAARDGREERRLVTVVFADISGFTALADQVDEEQLVEIMNPVLTTMSGVVDRYGGHVEKFAGDAVLAFFGAPVAHDDDAIRAVLAARDMRREVASVVASLPPEARHLTLHVGINTGHVVTGGIVDEVRLDQAVVGDAVNVASDLRPPARAEGCVGELTYLLARSAMGYEPVGELTVKGKPEPVRAWRMLSESGPQRLPPSGRDITSVFGRELELARLDAVLATIRPGQPRMAALLGEPGVGKSRLLAELRDRSEDAGIRWLESRCLSYGAALPYRPYADLLRTLTGVEPDDDPLTATSRVASFAAQFGLDEAPYVPYLIGVGHDGIPSGVLDNPEALRRSVHEAVVEIFVALACESPTVFAVEDLHWADAATVVLTRMIATRCADLPLGTVVTSRPEGRALVQDLAVEVPGSSVVLDLARLDRAGIEMLVSGVLGQSDDLLVELVAERTSGNPLFVQEVLRSLLDSNALVRGSTGWRVAARQVDLLPTSIESVLAARIDLLPRDAARLLQVASVIGREVHVPLLRAIADTDPDTVDSLIELLVQHEFLDRTDATQPLAFHHALVVEVAYGRLLRRHRRRLHRELVDVASRLYGTGDEVIDLLAHHAQRADMGAAALPYLMKAAGRASRLFANDEAVSLLEIALEAARAGDSARSQVPELLVELATLHELAGRYEKSRDLYERAAELGAGLRAYLGQASCLSRLGRYHQCLDKLHEAERINRDLSPADPR